MQLFVISLICFAGFIDLCCATPFQPQNCISLTTRLLSNVTQMHSDHPVNISLWECADDYEIRVRAATVNASTLARNHLPGAVRDLGLYNIAWSFSSIMETNQTEECTFVSWLHDLGDVTEIASTIDASKLYNVVPDSSSQASDSSDDSDGYVEHTAAPKNKQVHSWLTYAFQYLLVDLGPHNAFRKGHITEGSGISIYNALSHVLKHHWQ